MKSKICNKCHISKLLSEFHKNHLTADGYRYDCKECRKSLKTKKREQVKVGYKLCPHCQVERLFGDFLKSKHHCDGLSSWCKFCLSEFKKIYYQENRKEIDNKHKEYFIKNFKKMKKYHQDYSKQDHLKRTYNLDFDKYLNMLESQNGVCAICGQPEKIKNQTLSVDHDHKTGKVRGLLCRECNWSLGGFKDDIEILYKAIEYLKGNN